MIRSERLICRLPIGPDSNALFDLFGDPSARLYTPNAEAPTMHEVREWIQLGKNDRAEGRRRLVVATVDTAAPPIGIIEMDFNGLYTEVHFALSAARRGRGYMAEALGATIRENPRLKPFIAIIDAENGAAARMLTRCGLPCRELLRAHRVHPMLGPTPRDCTFHST